MERECDAATLVYVEDLLDPVVALEDVHHLEHVLRVRPGEVVLAADGMGNWRRCLWPASRRSGRDGRPQLEPAGQVVGEPKPAWPVTVALPPLKGDRTEQATRQLTEVGVDRIVIVTLGRASTARRAAKQAGLLRRLERVARSAGMQARRARLPVISEGRSMGELLGSATGAAGTGGSATGAAGTGGSATGAAGTGVALAIPGGRALTRNDHFLLVGPEGGFTQDEMDQALANGAHLVGLGPYVLRVETAAVVAGAAMVLMRDGLVAEAGPGHATP